MKMYVRWKVLISLGFAFWSISCLLDHIWIANLKSAEGMKIFPISGNASRSTVLYVLFCKVLTQPTKAPCSNKQVHARSNRFNMLRKQITGTTCFSGASSRSWVPWCCVSAWNSWRTQSEYCTFSSQPGTGSTASGAFFKLQVGAFEISKARTTRREAQSQQNPCVNFQQILFGQSQRFDKRCLQIEGATW